MEVACQVSFEMQTVETPTPKLLTTIGKGEGDKQVKDNNTGKVVLRFQHVLPWRAGLSTSTMQLPTDEARQWCTNFQ
ncbi:unnamed protein product [Ceratitis capitata]|uniref:(Mediterranean fruit fly) hypothetical protein n=1 Tax=Ceratitis capitata TaxID=7213 RepID=A0A811UMQ0_CERCA|nr:unnamed protein product [Ceratitis capitata]